MEEKLYFAYGSNINLDQMAHRCPNAAVVAPAMLEHYELLFRGNSGGYGVATIRPQYGSFVYGLLWKLTAECERSLDRYEGYPHLYRKQEVKVLDVDGNLRTVMAYVMTNERLRDPVLPSTDYYNGIREGYRQNGLPVRRLESALQQVRREAAAQEDKKPLWHFDHYCKGFGKYER